MIDKIYSETQLRDALRENYSDETIDEIIQNLDKQTMTEEHSKEVAELYHYLFDACDNFASVMYRLAACPSDTVKNRLYQIQGLLHNCKRYFEDITNVTNAEEEK